MKEKKIKKPVNKGYVRVPVVMQMEAVECGAASLAMILAYYGKWITLERARDDCGISRDGSSARDILRAGRAHGLEVQGFRQNVESLCKDGQFPCIVHWEGDHFIVLDGIKNGKAYINDPSRGFINMPLEEFEQGYTGICLNLKPGENFEMSGRKPGVWKYVKKSLKGSIPAVIFSLFITAVMSVSEILNKGFSQYFMDELLTGRSLEKFREFMFLLLTVILIQVVCSGVRDVYMLRMEGRISVFGNASYMWKVLRLPMRFFSQRLAGDIQQRQNLHAEIANELISKIAPAVLNLCMLIFYLIIMLRYSPALTAVGLAGMGINALTGNLISRKRVNITRVLMRDEGLLDAATVSGVEMIETLKSSGGENGFFQRWAGYNDSVNELRNREEIINARYGMIPQIISDLINYTVLFMGVWLIEHNQFTEGMLFAFQGYLQSFMSPVESLISASQDVQEMRSKMERVEDVMEYPIDKSCENLEREDLPDESYEKLSGALSMKNISFGYSKFAPPLIDDFSLELKPGSSVAFVGASGCGKSTLANMISGLYRPWSGEVLFDGKTIDEIDHNVFTGSVTVVDQDIIVFEDTIANNIKMWDSTIEDYEMVMAARDASLHEDIMKRDGGYSHMLEENGRNLSGGQRQRLEIARVLAGDPTIVVMDEATSALDAKTEYRVMKAIRDRGITCVIIAHRLSTIRDCDEIIVLDQGKVVQRGTHQQLMKEGGYYSELVSSE